MLAIGLMNRFVHRPFVTIGGPPGTLRLLTWNVGKVYLRWESRASDRDLKAVARAIHDFDVHIIALQEIRGPVQLGKLLSLLGPKWKGHAPVDAYDRQAGLITRLPVRFIELPTSSGRTAQGAEVMLPGGRPIVVASIHLDAFDARRRLQQAEEILAGAQRLGHQELFLLGDFNFDPVEAARNARDRQLYRILTRELQDATAGVSSTSLAGRHLDYVFFRSRRASLQELRILQERAIGSMDHYPVLAEFRLR